MKQLKNHMYRDICSVLSSFDKTYKTSQNLVLFSRILSTYPSNNIYCMTSHRIISYIERNISSMNLMIDIMKNEGEDQEIIDTVKLLSEKPTITTDAEITSLCTILSDYLKFANIIKAKNSFIKSLDFEEDNYSNIKETCDNVYKLANSIVNAYNVANVTSVQHQFDSDDKESMKNVIAMAKDARDPNKILLTSIKGLNTILSPGYVGGSVYVFSACPGNYKSGILLQSHVDACRVNKHIVRAIAPKKPISMYISMENSMSQTIRRLWSILFPNADMSMYTVDEIADMINSELESGGFRSVILYYGYREKSTADIANIIRSYNNENNEVVALFFDYIKRVRPARTDAAATSSEKAELNAIMNEFKLMAINFNIPIITAHQQNRQTEAALEAIRQSGGYNKTDQGLQRSGIGSAYEVVEVADWIGILNIEHHPDNKYLVIKSVKQREKESSPDSNIMGIRQPFMSPDSFTLRPDFSENVPLFIPIYNGIQHVTSQIAV